MIAVLSDIHGNLEALSAVLSHIKFLGINRVILLGDIVDYGADSVEVINTLYKLKIKEGYEIVGIRGNHENVVLSNNIGDLVKTSHGRLSVETTRNEISHSRFTVSRLNKLLDYGSYREYENFKLFHGSLSNPVNGIPITVNESRGNYFKVNWSCRVLPEIHLGGHSHIQGYYTSKSGFIYINPGSVGQPRNGDPRAQFAVIGSGEYNDRYVIFYKVDYDIDSATKKILVSGRPRFLAQRLYLGI